MNEADIYVRDHLLIQFMVNYYVEYTSDDVETIYQEWINWLKEQEEKHAERS